jgi:hypothetical protein
MNGKRGEVLKELRRAIEWAIGYQEGLDEGWRIAALRVVEGRFGIIPGELRVRTETADAAWCDALISNALRVESISELSLP